MEHLEFTARAYGVSEADFKHRTEKLLDLFRMREKSTSLSTHLSKGMRQKVMIMCAFVAGPRSTLLMNHSSGSIRSEFVLCWISCWK